MRFGDCIPETTAYETGPVPGLYSLVDVVDVPPPSPEDDGERGPAMGYDKMSPREAMPRFRDDVPVRGGYRVIEIAPDDDVRFGDVARVIEIAHGVGFTEPILRDPSQLAVPVD